MTDESKIISNTAKSDRIFKYIYYILLILIFLNIIVSITQIYWAYTDVNFPFSTEIHWSYTSKKHILSYELIQIFFQIIIIILSNKFIKNYLKRVGVLFIGLLVFNLTNLSILLSKLLLQLIS